MPDKFWVYLQLLSLKEIEIESLWALTENGHKKFSFMTETLLSKDEVKRFGSLIVISHFMLNIYDKNLFHQSINLWSRNLLVPFCVQKLQSFLSAFSAWWWFTSYEVAFTKPRLDCWHRNMYTYSKWKHALHFLCSQKEGWTTFLSPTYLVLNMVLVSIF